MSCLKDVNLERISEVTEKQGKFAVRKPVLVSSNRRALDRVAQAVNDAVDAALANGSLPA